MNQICLALVTIFVFHASVYATDKIEIGYPDASGTFLSLPLGQKTGIFQKEGIQADLIRIRSTVALTALVSGELDYHSVLGPAVAAAIRSREPVHRSPSPPPAVLGVRMAEKVSRAA